MKGPFVAITRAAVLLGAMAMMRPAPAAAALAALDTECPPRPTGDELIAACGAQYPGCTVYQVSTEEQWSEDRTECSWNVQCIVNC